MEQAPGDLGVVQLSLILLFIYYLLSSKQQASIPKSATFYSSQLPACTLNEHIMLNVTDQISIVCIHPQVSLLPRTALSSE